MGCPTSIPRSLEISSLAPVTLSSGAIPSQGSRHFLEYRVPTSRERIHICHYFTKTIHLESWKSSCIPCLIALLSRAKALSTLRGAALFFLIRCREEHAQTPIHCVTPKPVHADDKSMHGIEDPQNRDCQELQYDFEVK